MTTRKRAAEEAGERAGAAEGAARDAPCRLPRGGRRAPKARRRNCASASTRRIAVGAVSRGLPPPHRLGADRAASEHRSSPRDEAGRGRHRDGAHQHGRARLSRGQPAGRARARRPRAARDHRPRQAEARQAGSRVKSGCGKLSPAYWRLTKPDGAASLAISPPSDIVLDVARAAEPPALEPRAPRLASRTALPRPASSEAFSLGDLQEFAARRRATSRPMQRRAKLLRGFRGDGAADLHATMMPKDGGSRLRRGHGRRHVEVAAAAEARHRDGRPRRHRHRRQPAQGTLSAKARPRSPWRHFRADPRRPARPGAQPVRQPWSRECSGALTSDVAGETAPADRAKSNPPPSAETVAMFEYTQFNGEPSGRGQLAGSAAAARPASLSTHHRSHRTGGRRGDRLDPHRHELSIIKASNARKSRYLYELTPRAEGRRRGAADPPNSATRSMRLRDKLADNEAAIRAHLNAVNEVATLMQSAIQHSENDGTYSAGEFGLRAMIKFIVAATLALRRHHRRGVLFVPDRVGQDDAPAPPPHCSAASTTSRPRSFRCRCCKHGRHQRLFPHAPRLHGRAGEDGEAVGAGRALIVDQVYSYIYANPEHRLHRSTRRSTSTLSATAFREQHQQAGRRGPDPRSAWSSRSTSCPRNEIRDNTIPPQGRRPDRAEAREKAEADVRACRGKARSLTLRARLATPQACPRLDPIR